MPGRLVINWKKVFTFFLMLFLFVSAGMLLPREIKGPIPRAWGYLEGKFNRDLTGWWFSSYQGEGNCRIVNGRAAFSCPGSKIIFGTVTPPDAKPYPHLWAVDSVGQILDSVCPATNPSCRQRRIFAVIDTKTMNILSQSPASDIERKQIDWGVKYLVGLKTGISE